MKKDLIFSMLKSNLCLTALSPLSEARKAAIKKAGDIFGIRFCHSRNLSSFTYIRLFEPNSKNSFASPLQIPLMNKSERVFILS